MCDVLTMRSAIKPRTPTRSHNGALMERCWLECVAVSQRAWFAQVPSAIVRLLVELDEVTVSESAHSAELFQLLHKVVITNGTSLLHKVVITNGTSLRLTATSSVPTVFCKRCHRGASHGLPVKPPVSEAQDALRPVSRAL